METKKTKKVTEPAVAKAAPKKPAAVKAAPVKEAAPVKPAPQKAVVAEPVKVAAAPAKAVAAPVKKAVEASSGVLHEEIKKHTPKGAAKQSLAHGVGRRKSAVARVWLRRGTGAIVINGLSHVEYFDTDIMRADAARPFAVVPMAARYDVLANVQGGGLVAQAGAVRLGISRALLVLDETVRSVLRQNGLLTCDSRVKERKKYGQKAARRKFQFVKR